MAERCVFLVVAAGRGSRAGAGGPKQYRELGGRQVLTRTLDALLAADPNSRAMVVIHADDRDLYDAAVAPLGADLREKLLAPVVGGATRQESVRNGLDALSRVCGAEDLVLIHDAARPFVSPALVARAKEAAREKGAAIPGVAVVDTIKQIAGDARIVATPARAALRAVQTPQAFRFGLIHGAHRAALAQAASELTDDAAVAEWAGHCVFVFQGEEENGKLTTMEDFLRAELKLLQDLPDIRIGMGFDVHALGAGDHVWLGGVKIAHDHGLIGHSDADVLLHALTDAVLGAIADGDIGSHFPPTDRKMARGLLRPVSGPRRRAGGGQGRARGPCRRHADVRAPQGGAAPRRHSRADRRNHGPVARPRGGEGNHNRETRVYRTSGRHRRAGGGDGASSLKVVETWTPFSDETMLDAKRATGQNGRQAWTGMFWSRRNNFWRLRGKRS